MANEFKIRKGLIVEGATGGTVVNVQGSLGQLFSVTDNLTGEIFAVADISGVPIMSINSSGVSYFDGKVGIGTSTPSRGDLVVKSDFQTIASGNGQLAIISKISGSNPAAQDIGGQMVFGGPISTTDSNRTFGLVGGYKENATSGDRAGYLTFGTRQNTGTRDIFERMRIDSIGNVGIGTDTPIIYTTGWGKVLGIKAASGYAVTQIAGSNGNGGELDLGDASIRHAAIASLPGSSLSFYTNSANSGASVTERIRILAGGNVGINDTSPDFKLDVGGTFGVSDLPANATSTSVLVKDETLGPELVSNKNFATGVSGWNLQNSSTVTGGIGTINATGALSSTGGNWSIYQTAVFTPSKKYLANYTVRRVSGTGTFQIAYSYGIFVDQTLTSSFQTFSVYYDTNSNNWPVLSMGGNTSGDVFEISYISVKQVTSASDQIKSRELGEGAFVDTEYWKADGNNIHNTNSANVGINDTTPLDLLHISAPSWAQRIQSTADASYLRLSANQIAAFASGGGGGSLFFNNSSAGNVLMAGGGGNVGINNTSPAKKLEISSPSSGDGIFLTGDGTGGGMATGSSRNIEFAYTDVDTSYGSAIKFEVPDSAIHGGQISFWTDSLTTAPAGQLVRAMTIDRKQNIGIGTSTPLARLDIQGTQGQLFSVTDDLSGEIFAVADISGVPIMTVNSSGLSTFDGNINVNAQILTPGGADLALNPNTGLVSIGGVLRATGTGNSYFAGNLGVGLTTTPGAKLHVDGNILTSGDVIIGTTSRIILKDQPAASTASGSGTIVKWTASQARTVGQVFSIKGDGGWTNAASGDSSATKMLGYTLGTNVDQGVLLQGFFYKSGHGFAIGDPLYLSGTQGTLTNTAPTTTGHFVRIIGYATSTDYIYFDPDKTWIELV